MSESTRSQDVYAMAPMPWSEPSSDTMTGLVDAIAGLPREQQRDAWDSIARQFEQRAEYDAAASAARSDIRSRSRLAVKRSAPPVVYYVRFGDRIKIGYTRNLSERLKALPHDELLATEPGGLEVESDLHARFARHRVTGEWFQACDEILDHIASLK